MTDLDPLIDEYKADIIAVLVEDARKAHIIGDLLAQKHLWNVGRHTHTIQNARKKQEPLSTPPTESAGFGLSFDHIAQESQDFIDQKYKPLLVKKGATIINGEQVNWLETHAEEVRQDLADTIASGVTEGWSTSTLADNLATVIDSERYKLDRIARTEMMRIQKNGMVNRYAAAGVPTVIRINGPNPCDICAAESGQEYPIDEVPDDHVNGACDFVPNIKIPPVADTLIPEDQIGWLLEQAV